MKAAYSSPLRVCTYARVSSIRQESEGQSLANQERTFQKWLERTNAQRIRKYVEAKSAKDVEGRDQFSQMLAELPTLGVDFVVVDTIDRFTRNLSDGLEILERFKQIGVKLFPIETGEAIELDDDRAWQTVVEDMTAAERERRRIRKRVIRSYEGRRERGATLHCRAPLGLQKVGDTLLPDPDLAPAIRHADALYVEGKSQDEILHYIQATCGERSWKTLNGVRQYLSNPEYVKAGLRSIETQAQINARLAIAKTRFGQKRTFVHPMAGVFACGLCVDSGHPAADSLMKGSCTPRELRTWGQTSSGARIICQSYPHRRHDANIGVQERILEMVFCEIFGELRADDDLLASWERYQESKRDLSQEKLLQKRLASIEQKESRLPERREQAFSLLSDENPAVSRQARLRLAELDAEGQLLSAEREAVLIELSSCANNTLSLPDAAELRTVLAHAAHSWHHFTNERRNQIARSFCEAVGSHPILYRGQERHPVEAVIHWPELLPGVVYKVLYGKGIDAKVEAIALPSPILTPLPKGVSNLREAARAKG